MPFIILNFPPSSRAKKSSDEWHFHHFTNIFWVKRTFIYLGTSFISDATDEEFGNAMASMYKYSTRFDGLKDNTDYTVSISTELDGKTITQVTMTAVSKSGSSSPGASESQPQHQEHNNKKDS